MSLLKMTILSFSATGIKQLTDIPQMYMVMFNPNSYKTELKVNFNEETPEKTETVKPRFKNVGPKQFNFDFVVDGTGAAGYKRDVGLDVKSFIKTVGYDKNIGSGSIRYLLLIWGGFIQKCVIESISVNYTLFSALGSPLRATISATFREYNDEPSELFKKIDSFLSSAPVQGAISVANAAFQVFNAVDQTVAIAKANDLDSIRAKVNSDNIKLP
jgi:Contractile injection system tube protein